MLHGLIDPTDVDRASALLAGGAPSSLTRAGALAVVATAPEALNAAPRPDFAPDPVDQNGAADDPEIAARLAADHHRALCLLAARLDVLPLRFGAVARRIEDAPRLILGEAGERAEPLRARFDALRGRAEYQIRLLHAAPKPAAAAPGPTAPPAAKPGQAGRAYLKRKLDRRRGAERRRESATALFDQVRAEARTLGPRAVEVAPARPEIALDLSLLCPRSGVAALSEAGARWAALAEPLGLSLRLVGPLPPFRFAGDETDAGPASGPAREGAA